MNRVYDQIYAIVYGHCIGDAIGLLTENLTKEEAKKVLYYNNFSYAIFDYWFKKETKKWHRGVVFLIVNGTILSNNEIYPLFI